MNKTPPSIHWEESASGYALLLDDVPAKTPLGNALALPNAKLAELVAAEWRRQGAKLRRETMPLTQIACIAIDFGQGERHALTADILDYADTDLVCYRNGDIPELQRLQDAGFDPLLDWAKDRFGIAFKVTKELMPVVQPATNYGKFVEALAQYDEWKLAALASCVKPLCSLILALALVEGRIDVAEALTLAHFEEDYETRKWGADDEKDAKRRKVNEEVLTVGTYLALIQ